jgi:hypothetical protein
LTIEVYQLAQLSKRMNIEQKVLNEDEN